MGTTHSLDLNAIAQSSLLKDIGWNAKAMAFISHNFINTEHDLERTLRKLLNVDDCIEIVLSDDRIKKMLPVRARILSKIIKELERMSKESTDSRLHEQYASIPDIKEKKCNMLRDAILRSYEYGCAEVFARVVDEKYSERVSFSNLDHIIQYYGSAVNRLFQKDMNASDDSLVRLIQSALRGNKDPIVKTGRTYPIRPDRPFTKDWLSIGLAGAEAIDLDKGTGDLIEIRYRTDEPLTRDVSRMLLRVLFTQSKQQGSPFPDWPSFFVHRVLQVAGSSNDCRELSVGYMFCRPEFQGKTLAELPFIKWDSRNLTGNDEEGYGFEKDWLKHVKFQCEDYVLLQHLVSLPPLHDVVATVDSEVSSEKVALLFALGASVRQKITSKTTHFIVRSAEENGDRKKLDNNGRKRLENALRKNIHCVSEEWIDRYVFCYPLQRW